MAAVRRLDADDFRSVQAALNRSRVDGNVSPVGDDQVRLGCRMPRGADRHARMRDSGHSPHELIPARNRSTTPCRRVRSICASFPDSIVVVR